MFDYTVNIYAGEEFTCTLGGNWVYYDDTIWWQLTELLKALDENPTSGKEIMDLLKKTEGSYWHLDEENYYTDSTDYKIDTVNRTISMPDMPVFEMDEELPCIKLIKKEDNYFAEYEDGEQIEMPFVYFDRTDLFSKKVVTFEEFLTVANFFNYLMFEGEKTKGNTDFILNDKQVIRFNAMSL